MYRTASAGRLALSQTAHPAVRVQPRRTAWHRLHGLSGIAAIAIAVSACGGGGGASLSPATPGGLPSSGGSDSVSAPVVTPAETLFVPANAWGGPIPAAAQRVDPEEFRRRVEAGELEIVRPAHATERRAASRRQFDRDLAALEASATGSPAIEALRAQARSDADPLRDRIVAISPDVRVRQSSLAVQVREAVDALAAARDPAVARSAYASSWALITPAARAGLPSPESLATASMDAVRAAQERASAALAAGPDLDRVRPEADAFAGAPMAGAATGERARAQDAGNGSDTVRCAPTNLHRRFWYPLKNFQPPIRSQGNRGTCWAFAAVGALEVRQRVRNDLFVDLSEQAFVNKVKNEWDRDEFNDGYSAERALAMALERGHRLAPETAWTYNRSASRADGAGDGEAAYAGSCDGYTGWCSDTSHQSPRVCTSAGLLQVCASTRLNFGAATEGSSPTTTLWPRDDGVFPLADLRARLAAGVPLLASMPVYVGLQRPVNGVVTDERRIHLDGEDKEQPGSAGGHAVLIVGFLANEDMATPGTAVNARGGGYFIVRNSWGCQGDGGYVYVPAAYVRENFLRLSEPVFEGGRNAAWAREQVFPGATSTLTVSGTSTWFVDLGVATDLARAALTDGTVAPRFEVRHDTAAFVRLTVDSDIDGRLYDGQWPVNGLPGGSFGRSLPATFGTPGLRQVTVTARYGDVTAATRYRLNVFNSPPVVAVDAPPNAAQGEVASVLARVRDPNEGDTLGLCSRTTWSVEAPDEVLDGPGCAQRVRFNLPGARRVTAVTTDAQGLRGASSVVVDVAAPPPNPFPRVTGGGVLERANQQLNGVTVGCQNQGVTAGSTIDLRRAGCTRLSINPVVPPRYFAAVDVENPAGETLTYDWELRFVDALGGVTRDLRRTTTPSFDLLAMPFGAAETSYACEAAVAVNAPDPARSKPQRTVWAGRCLTQAATPR